MRTTAAICKTFGCSNVPQPCLATQYDAYLREHGFAGPTDGLTRLCSSPRPPPLPLWNVSRAEYVELSRDVHDAYVESSVAQAKSIEPPSPVGNGIDPHRFAKCVQYRTVP